jgi:hypothetical protein
MVAAVFHAFQTGWQDAWLVVLTKPARLGPVQLHAWASKWLHSLQRHMPLKQKLLFPITNFSCDQHTTPPTIYAHVAAKAKACFLRHMTGLPAYMCVSLCHHPTYLLPHPTIHPQASYPALSYPLPLPSSHLSTYRHPAAQGLVPRAHQPEPAHRYHRAHKCRLTAGSLVVRSYPGHGEAGCVMCMCLPSLHAIRSSLCGGAVMPNARGNPGYGYGIHCLVFELIPCRVTDTHLLHQAPRIR